VITQVWTAVVSGTARSRKAHHENCGHRRNWPDWVKLDAFVADLAHRIASFPADAVRATKHQLNALTLPATDAVRADARRFQRLVASDVAKARTATLFAHGLQTRSELELGLGHRIAAVAGQAGEPGLEGQR
jgi:hypothetical protein